MLPTEKLYRLDLQFITDNCLNRKLWEKKWIIFQYDKITASLYIQSIDVVNNKLRLSIKLDTKDRSSYTSSSYYGSNDVVIPLDKAQQNMENALRQVVSSIRIKILMYEKDIARSYIGFQRAVDYDNYMNTIARERAEELLDEEGITNYDIREAYIDSCVGKHETYRANEFLTESEYRTRSHYYLMLAAYFYPGDEEKYNKALSDTGMNTKTKTYEQYKEDMTEYIKAVHNDEVEEFMQEMKYNMDMEDIT